MNVNPAIVLSVIVAGCSPFVSALLAAAGPGSTFSSSRSLCAQIGVQTFGLFRPDGRSPMANRLQISLAMPPLCDVRTRPATPTFRAHMNAATTLISGLVLHFSIGVLTCAPDHACWRSINLDPRLPVALRMMLRAL